MFFKYLQNNFVGTITNKLSNLQNKLDIAWTNVNEAEYITANIQDFTEHDEQMKIVFDKITIPLERRAKIQQLSEIAKKELQEYSQYLNIYRQIAFKTDEKKYVTAAKEAKTIYQQKAETIENNKPL